MPSHKHKPLTRQQVRTHLLAVMAGEAPLALSGKPQGTVCVVRGVEISELDDLLHRTGLPLRRIFGVMAP